MDWHRQQFSAPIHHLIERSLVLAKVLINNGCKFYPFAGVYRDDHLYCLFSDHASDTLRPSHLIELLQWQIIDYTTGSNAYSVLVYNATGKHRSESFDAIAITLRRPNGEETDLLYPYTTQNGKVVIAPPMVD